MARFCGLDFGTSNSVIAAVSDDGASDAILREPTLMYFPEDPESTAERYCGSPALERYVADGMTGRFFQSIKTVLPDPSFVQTVINGKRFAAEDLVAVMLRHLRTAMEERIGESITRAVIGRPARFSPDQDMDELARQRLSGAARQAGFQEVVFEYEPVAGAQSYLSRATGESLVFVADHGGGTSDFTVMRLRAREILATHGIRAGGDDFDAEIMWNRIVELFGYGSHYESFDKYLPVPVHIFRIISRWDQIHFLKTTRYRDELRYYLRSSDNPLAIRRLIKLVEENLGLFVSRAVERAKIDLSSLETARVEYQKDKLRISEAIERDEFQRYIAGWLSSIEDAVEETVRRAGIDEAEVDAVFMTGGSSTVPAVRAILERRFPAGRLVSDARRFDSVAEGLALAARQRNLTVN